MRTRDRPLGVILVASTQFLLIFVVLAFAEGSALFVGFLGQLGSHQGAQASTSELSQLFFVLSSPTLVAFGLSGIGLLLLRKWAWYLVLSLSILQLLPMLLVLFGVFILAIDRGKNIWVAIVGICLVVFVSLCLTPQYLLRPHVRELFQVSRPSARPAPSFKHVDTPPQAQPSGEGSLPASYVRVGGVVKPPSRAGRATAPSFSPKRSATRPWVAYPVVTILFVAALAMLQWDGFGLEVNLSLSVSAALIVVGVGLLQLKKWASIVTLALWSITSMTILFLLASVWQRWSVMKDHKLSPLFICAGFIAVGLGLLRLAKWAWIVAVALSVINLSSAIMIFSYTLIVTAPQFPYPYTNRFGKVIISKVLVDLVTRATASIGPPFALWYLTRARVKEAFRN